jgi:glycosyltransferase involved in cell wall biosynthesis
MKEAVPLVTVIVPCYNEEAIIEDTARTLLERISECAASFQIILCNDGSTDQTAAKVASLAERHPHITAVGYPSNRGAGYAFRQGLFVARGRYIIHMDADLAMDPLVVCRLCTEGLQRCDIVIASRYKGVRADYPWRRRLPSFVYRMIYRGLLGLPIRDAMSGFFGLRRTVLDVIPPLEMDGFEVYLELFLEAHSLGLQIEEIPAKFVHHTESGEVSVLAQGPKQLFNTLRVWHRHRRRRVGALSAPSE